MTDPKYVVVDEMALGAILNVDVQVLASYSMHIDCPGVYPAPPVGKRMRPALPRDFKHFRVSPPPNLRAAFDAIATYAADMKTLAADTPAAGDPRIADLDARWRAIEAAYPDAMAALEAHFEGEGE